MKRVVLGRPHSFIMTNLTRGLEENRVYKQIELVAHLRNEAPYYSGLDETTVRTAVKRSLEVEMEHGAVEKVSANPVAYIFKTIQEKYVDPR